MSDEADELDGLLDELDDLKDTGPGQGPSPSPIPAPSPVIQPSLVPAADIKEEMSVPVPVPNNPTMPDGALDIGTIIRYHNEHYEDIRRNLATDRGKADALVALLLGRVQAGGATDVETESLVKALEVLARTNDSAVRLLDSKSRLLTSAKSGLMIQQNMNINASPEDLQKILDEPIGEV